MEKDEEKFVINNIIKESFSFSSSLSFYLLVLVLEFST